MYTNAGRRALEKQVSKEYRDQWTKNYSQLKPPNRKKYSSMVVFRLGVEWFGLPTQYFKSVENLGVIHSVPRFSNHMLIGIVNIRGALQLCFSVGNLLQVAAVGIDGTDSTVSVGVYRRLLVLLNSNQYYVFPVDEVGGVERVDESILEVLPATINERHAELVKGTITTSRYRFTLLNAPQMFATLEAAIGDR